MDLLVGDAASRAQVPAVSTVVGIFPTSDTISTLAHEIKARGLDPSRLVVISNDEPSGYLASIGARFVGALEPARISGDVDVAVPGLRTGAPSDLNDQETSPALEALSDLAVPDGRTDDFMRAVDAGRSVAGFPAADDADALRAMFSAAGANPVAVF